MNELYKMHQPIYLIRIESLCPGEKKKMGWSRSQVRSLIIRHPFRINDTMILSMVILLQRSITSSRIWCNIFRSTQWWATRACLQAIISEALVSARWIDFVYNQSSILLTGKACSPQYKGRETRINSWKAKSKVKLHLSLRPRTVGITNLERDHCGKIFVRRFTGLMDRTAIMNSAIAHDGDTALYDSGSHCLSRLDPIPCHGILEVPNHLWSTEILLVIKLLILRISLTKVYGLIWGVCLGWLNIHY